MSCTSDFSYDVMFSYCGTKWANQVRRYVLRSMSSPGSAHWARNLLSTIALLRVIADRQTDRQTDTL